MIKNTYSTNFSLISDDIKGKILILNENSTMTDDSTIHERKRRTYATIFLSFSRKISLVKHERDLVKVVSEYGIGNLWIRYTIDVYSLYREAASC